MVSSEQNNIDRQCEVNARAIQIISAALHERYLENDDANEAARVILDRLAANVPPIVVEYPN